MTAITDVPQAERKGSGADRRLSAVLVALVVLSLRSSSFAVWSDRPLEATPPQSPGPCSERTLFLRASRAAAARVIDAERQP